MSTADRELHLKGLILVRALLEQRGASEAEIGAHSDAIARVRAELAEERSPTPWR